MNKSTEPKSPVPKQISLKDLLDFDESDTEMPVPNKGSKQQKRATLILDEEAEAEKYLEAVKSQTSIALSDSESEEEL